MASQTVIPASTPLKSVLGDRILALNDGRLKDKFNWNALQDRSYALEDFTPTLTLPLRGRG